jgi:hypothetical protein
MSLLTDYFGDILSLLSKYVTRNKLKYLKFLPKHPIQNKYFAVSDRFYWHWQANGLRFDCQNIKSPYGGK